MSAADGGRGSKCGTYAGWNAHRYAGEKPCDPCRSAQAQYARERRAKRSRTVVLEGMKNRARQRALWRLKELHREEFDLLVADEMRVELAAEREAARRRARSR